MPLIDKEKDVEWGNRFRLLRTGRGLSQKELAASGIDLSLPTIQRYETGELPTAKGIKKILSFFSCSKLWLLTGEGEKYLSVPEELPTLDVKEPSSGYAVGADTQKINIDEAMGQTYKVLSSGTPYAVALYLNIQQFSSAIDATKEVRVCQESIAVLQDQVAELRRQVDRLTAPPTSPDQPAPSSEKEVM